jgi:hypothetical protein
MSLKVQVLQVYFLLVAIVSNLGLGGPCLASLVFIAHDLPFHGLHVDCCFPFPPSWLQLLMTFLVIVIFILVV